MALFAAGSQPTHAPCAHKIAPRDRQFVRLAGTPPNDDAAAEPLILAHEQLGIAAQRAADGIGPARFRQPRIERQAIERRRDLERSAPRWPRQLHRSRAADQLVQAAVAVGLAHRNERQREPGIEQHRAERPHAHRGEDDGKHIGQVQERRPRERPRQTGRMRGFGRLHTQAEQILPQRAAPASLAETPVKSSQRRPSQVGRQSGACRQDQTEQQRQ